MDLLFWIIALLLTFGGRGENTRVTYAPYRTDSGLWCQETRVYDAAGNEVVDQGEITCYRP